MSKSTIPFFAAFLCFSLGGYANERESADYQLEFEVDDAGGGKAASADYEEIGSSGGEGTKSTGSGEVELFHGFTGEVYDIVSISLVASPGTVDEKGTRKIDVDAVADDGSALEKFEGISFSIEAGPLASVSSDGLVLADIVFQDTPAKVRGDFGLLTDELDLTVLDTISDNFGSYAEDDLPDDWQVEHFGQDNPNAGPGEDPDGDMQNNAFEFVAGVIPTDPLSLFQSRIELVPGTEMHRIVFSPVLPDRTYSPRFSFDVGATGWDPLAAFTTSDLPGGERAFTDTDPDPPARKFYEIRIEKN